MTADGERVRLLLTDPDVRGRLRVLTALREHYDVQTLGPDETTLKATRRLRPELVLLAMPRGRLEETGRWCRAIKTDAGEPPLVGIVDRFGRVEDPEAMIKSCLGDGYLGGVPGPQDLLDFLSALRVGRRPLVRLESTPSLRQRLRSVFGF
jgi:hypothetical protein